MHLLARYKVTLQYGHLVRKGCFPYFLNINAFCYQQNTNTPRHLQCAYDQPLLSAPEIQGQTGGPIRAVAACVSATVARFPCRCASSQCVTQRHKSDLRGWITSPFLILRFLSQWSWNLCLRTLQIFFCDASKIVSTLIDSAQVVAFC